MLCSNFLGVFWVSTILKSYDTIFSIGFLQYLTCENLKINYFKQAIIILSRFKISYVKQVSESSVSAVQWCVGVKRIELLVFFSNSYNGFPLQSALLVCHPEAHDVKG